MKGRRKQQDWTEEDCKRGTGPITPCPTGEVSGVTVTCKRCPGRGTLLAQSPDAGGSQDRDLVRSLQLRSLQLRSLQQRLTPGELTAAG